jgi:hypothetical protein
MTNSTNKVLGIKASLNGNELGLIDKVFNNVELDEFVIGPVKPNELTIKLENVVFSNCFIASRRFVVREGVILKNVTFDNVESEDALTISTNSLLDGVVVKGNPSHGALWVRPDEVLDEKRDRELRAWILSKIENIDFMLDISDFEGEVEILGLPPEKVKYNADRHHLITKDWNERCDWKQLDIPPTSFWRLSLRRLKTFDVESGIFSLPEKNDKRFELALEDMEKLKQVGLI